MLISTDVSRHCSRYETFDENFFQSTGFAASLEVVHVLSLKTGKKILCLPLPYQHCLTLPDNAENNE